MLTTYYTSAFSSASGRRKKILRPKIYSTYVLRPFLLDEKIPLPIYPSPFSPFDALR